jgi:hypothetical protein
LPHRCSAVTRTPSIDEARAPIKELSDVSFDRTTTGYQAVDGFSISKKGNKMQEAKKNPSDPDAVVTADAGAVWVAE